MKNNIDEIRKRADLNLRDTIVNRIKNTSTGKLIETDKYIIYSIGMSTTDPHLNGGLLLDDNYAEEFIGKTSEFFNDLDYDYSIWIGGHENKDLEKILKGEGYKASRERGSAGMVIFEPIKDLNLDKKFNIKEVNSEKQVKEFQEITKEAFEKSDEEVSIGFSNLGVLNNENTKSYIIYEDEKPVSAGISSISRDSGGIYYIGTLEEKRGSGLGSYIVKESTNKAFEMGKGKVILQASRLGERVYKKLGYETITRYRTYKIER